MLRPFAERFTASAIDPEPGHVVPRVDGNRGARRHGPWSSDRCASAGSDPFAR